MWRFSIIGYDLVDVAFFIFTEIGKKNRISTKFYNDLF